jgi:hypothetical protein
MVHRQADQQHADPGRHAADDLGIGGAEEPTQILSFEIAENANRF